MGVSVVNILKVLLLSFVFVSVISCSAPSPKQPKGKWEMVNPSIQKQKKLNSQNTQQGINK